jgi:hypothetical protein
MIHYSQSDLAHAAPPATRAGVPAAWLTNYRLREIASDVVILVAVLAFVLTFFALRMALFAPADVIERVAIPVAAGAAVVSVLAFIGALLLRHGHASGPKR